MFKTSCCISFLRTAIFLIFPVHLHLNTYTCFKDYVIVTKYKNCIKFMKNNLERNIISYVISSFIFFLFYRNFKHQYC